MKSLTMNGIPSSSTDLVNRHDRRVTQLRRRCGPRGGNGPCVVGGEVAEPRNLEGHDPVELGVAGLVHRAERRPYPPSRSARTGPRSVHLARGPVAR